jgi:aspartate/tyrosine/aromatic aminotransferase
MFAFTGLSKDMVVDIRDSAHVYMTMDGRISIAGLNTGNIDYVADAMHKVTHGKKL